MQVTWLGDMSAFILTVVKNLVLTCKLLRPLRSWLKTQQKTQTFSPLSSASCNKSINHWSSWAGSTLLIKSHLENTITLLHVHVQITLRSKQRLLIKFMVIHVHAHKTLKIKSTTAQLYSLGTYTVVFIIVIFGCWNNQTFHRKINPISYNNNNINKIYIPVHIVTVVHVEWH